MAVGGLAVRLFGRPFRATVISVSPYTMSCPAAHSHSITFHELLWGTLLVWQYVAEQPSLVFPQASSRPSTI